MVQRCTLSGNQLIDCAPTTSAAGTTYQWEAPWGITYSNNRLYVADYNARTLAVCDDNGSGELDCEFNELPKGIGDVSVDGNTVYATNFDDCYSVFRCTLSDKQVQNWEEIPILDQGGRVWYIGGTWGA